MFLDTSDVVYEILQFLNDSSTVMHLALTSTTLYKMICFSPVLSYTSQNYNEEKKLLQQSQSSFASQYHTLWSKLLVQEFSDESSFYDLLSETTKSYKEESEFEIMTHRNKSITLQSQYEVFKLAAHSKTENPLREKLGKLFVYAKSYQQPLPFHVFELFRSWKCLRNRWKQKQNRHVLIVGLDPETTCTTINNTLPKRWPFKKHVVDFNLLQPGFSNEIYLSPTILGHYQTTIRGYMSSKIHGYQYSREKSRLIYVISSKHYVEHIRLMYRHFHNIIGDNVNGDVKVLVIADSNLKPSVDSVLRLQSVHSCDWYNSAHIKVTSTLLTQDLEWLVK